MLLLNFFLYSARHNPASLQAPLFVFSEKIVLRRKLRLNSIFLFEAIFLRIFVYLIPFHNKLTYRKLLVLFLNSDKNEYATFNTLG